MSTLSGDLCFLLKKLAEEVAVRDLPRRFWTFLTEREEIKSQIKWC